ncbi:methionyl-tRNA formyltransferase [Desulforamulus reducens MI-1]|uniref:Methionyl-tRNA formyltransferase n=1 Tax=Desulforamulus reducens (strain ATCC BAA-1160 / DSM 100696 / MI-1) TaxID=349161 RepID=FMT_DESRM|nr:methionyl-tRNA formyltransferase [Desulforamulus reducens]A4J579.1 RecName: Full=Methionyl-tRNA formyltransferase [Desulforamulus reducens MI-1]ABO50232.1 methionyl-tRNA formyltransferase [Desulforamulus reducens MI-1]
MRIVFMGTPDFAATSLKALIDAGQQVVAVVTQPDKPKGRGRQVQPPPVKVLANEYKIPVLQPTSIKINEFQQTIEELKPECIVVVAYGKILPTEILELPPKGCINVHASLLPYYRGSAPIHWAIINGEEETGVTTMFMDKGMDTGDMILKSSVSIGPSDTVGAIHDKLASDGAKLLIETIHLLEEDCAPRIPQNHKLATYAPMLRKEHELIHWDLSAKDIHNHVRGMNPWPGTYTIWDNKILKIWQTTIPAHQNIDADPGTVLEVSPSGILVQTAGGQILIKELQLQGSRRMEVTEFLRGKQMSPGTVLGFEGGRGN